MYYIVHTLTSSAKCVVGANMFSKAGLTHTKSDSSGREGEFAPPFLWKGEVRFTPSLIFIDVAIYFSIVKLYGEAT